MLVRLLSGWASPILVNFGLEVAPQARSLYMQIVPGWEKIQIAPGEKSHLGKQFAARLGEQSEWGTLWWDMRLACKRTCLFVSPPYGSMEGYLVYCVFFVIHFVSTVTDFSVAERGRGVKFCIRVGLLSAQLFTPFGELWLAESHGLATLFPGSMAPWNNCLSAWHGHWELTFCEVWTLVIAFLEGNSKIGLRQAAMLSLPTISFDLHAKTVEEIDLEMCNFRNFRSSMILTLTLDRVEVILARISGRGLPTYQIRAKSGGLFVDVQTDRQDFQ